MNAFKIHQQYLTFNTHKNLFWKCDVAAVVAQREAPAAGMQ